MRRPDPFNTLVVLALGALLVAAAFLLANPFVGGVP